MMRRSFPLSWGAWVLIALVLGACGEKPPPPQDSLLWRIGADPRHVLVEGPGASLVAVVGKASGEPLVDAEVRFLAAAKDVVVRQPPRTDAEGRAVGHATSAKAGRKVISAQVRWEDQWHELGNIELDFAGVPARLVFLDPPGRGRVNQPLTPIRVAVEDKEGNRVGWQSVTLTLRSSAPMAGVLEAKTVEGVAQFDLTPLTIGSYTLTVSHAALSSISTSILVEPGPPSATRSELLLQTSTPLPADGRTPAQVVAQVRDADGFPLAGKTVTLSVAPASGTTLQQATTDSEGMALLQFTSTVAGRKRVTATVAGVALLQVLEVDFHPGPPDGTRSTIVVSPTQVIADGVNSAAVTVTVRDALGNAVPGAQVILAVEPPQTSDLVLVQPEVSDASGTAQGRLSATRLMTLLVSARVAHRGSFVDLSQRGSVTFVPGPPSASRSGVTVSPPAPLADGSEEAVVTVGLRDARGHPTSGIPVQVSASGEGVTIVQPAPTRDNGVTWAKLRSNVPGLKTLILTVDTGAQAVVLDSRPVVRFSPPPEVASAAVPPGTLSGCVPVSFSLRHESERRADLLIEVDPDGSGNFRRATQAPSATHEGVEGLTSSSASAGAPHVFLWDSSADVPRSSTRVALRLRTRVAGAEGASVTLSNLSVLNGTLSFSGTPYEPGGSPAALAAGDLDGDGDPDLALVMRELGRVRLLFQVGDRPLSWAAPLDVTVGTGPSALAVEDLNVDGWRDLVVANETDGTLTVLRQRAPGQFEPQAPLGTGLLPRAVTAVDLDRDGWPDLVAANSGSHTVSVFRQNPTSGTFEAAGSWPVGTSPRDVVVADLDGDGRRDIVTADSGADTVSVLWQTALGGFERTAISVGGQPVALAWGDVDRNGRLDLAVARASGGTVDVLLQSQAVPRSFSAGPSLPAPGSPWDVALADVDLDGWLDVTVAGSAGVRLHPGASSLAFLAPLALDPRGAVALHLGDVDRDGRPDVVPALTEAAGTVLRGVAPVTCNPHLTGRRAMGLSRYGGWLGTYDIDADGKPDLIRSVPDEQSVMFARGLGDGSFGTPVQVAAGLAARELAVGDVDGDGRADLVATDSRGPAAKLYLQSRSERGTFLEPILLPAEGGSSSPQVADFNGDGLADIALVRPWQGVRVFHQRADAPGTFEAPLSAEASDASALALMDLQGDGGRELLAATSRGVCIVNATASGYLVAPCLPDTRTRELIATDIDGDGLEDLVLGGPGQPLAVLLQSRTERGTFPTRRSAATTSSTDLKVADENGDGRLDVLYQDNFRPCVWRQVDPPGTFVSPDCSSRLSGAITQADFNADGRPDFAFGDYSTVVEVSGSAEPLPLGRPWTSADGVALAELTGDSHWDVVAKWNHTGYLDLYVQAPAPPLAFPQRARTYTGLEQVELAAGDLDQDGRPDLIAAGGDLWVGYQGSEPLTYPRALAFSTGRHVDQVVLGDVDQDGQLELVVLEHTSTATNFAVLERSATGTRPYEVAARYGLASSAYRLSLADVDRDGRLDVLASTPQGVMLARQSTQERGTFLPAVMLQAIGDHALEDFNRDGLVDLAWCPGGELKLAYQSAASPGTFLAPITIASSVVNPCYLAAADLNADGWMDLAAAGAFMELYLQSPSSPGTFPRAVQRYGYSPQQLVARDMDGDGRTDLVLGDGLIHILKVR